jgi:5-methyltetrahydropteroyltriglutamate--homocysteine methyltransferase
MFTVTRDVMLPTSVTGSWPRPTWYDANLHGRPLSEWMTDAAYREKFLDAIAVVINEQEWAGLDILTNGDYHLDADFGGRSWFYYPVERLAGLSETALEMTDPRYSAPPGTYLQEIMSAWRYPKVEGRLALRPDLPLEYAKVWRVAQGRTDRPVKFGTVSAQTIVSVLANKGAHREADLIADLSSAMNAELRALAAAGCRAIQIEDPLPHIVLSVNPGADRGWVDFLIDAFNEEVKGLDDVEVWIHTCWGNPGAQRVQDRTSYAESIEIYLERMHGDVWTVEAPGGDIPALLELFEPYRGSLSKKIALGVISHRTVQVESVAEVAASVRAAAAVIGPENLAVTSDCGFGRQGVPRAVALFKASALVQGTNVVRGELGLPQARVRSADAALQVDVNPAA